MMETDEIIIDKTYFKLEGDDNDGEGDCENGEGNCENENSKQSNSPENFFKPEILRWNPYEEDEKEENEDWFDIPLQEKLVEEQSLFVKVKKKFRW